MSVWIIKSIRIVTEYDYFWNYCKRINVTFKNFYSIIFNVLRQKLIKQRKIGKSDKVNLIRGSKKPVAWSYRCHLYRLFLENCNLQHVGTLRYNDRPDQWNIDWKKKKTLFYVITEARNSGKRPATIHCCSLRTTASYCRDGLRVYSCYVFSGAFFHEKPRREKGKREREGEKNGKS